MTARQCFRCGVGSLGRPSAAGCTFAGAFGVTVGELRGGTDKRCRRGPSCRCVARPRNARMRRWNGGADHGDRRPVAGTHPDEQAGLVAAEFPGVAVSTTAYAEHATLVTGHATPVTGHATAVTGHATPVTEHATPVTGHATPVTEHAAPVTEHATPVTEHATPVTEHTTPVTEHATPVTEHAASVTEHATPVHV